MTREQLSGLSDDVRIPAEIVFEYLKSLNFFPHNVIITGIDRSGIVLLFTRDRGDITITADVEIDENGTVTGSVIPMLNTPDGLKVVEDPDLLAKFPIDYWDIEEVPPYEESFWHIRQRFGLVSQDSSIVPAI